MAEWQAVQGDAGTVLRVLLWGATDGDLTGWSVRLLARLRGASGAPAITRACVVGAVESRTHPVTNQPANVTPISVTLTAADLLVPGTFDVQWEGTLGAAVTTWPAQGYDLLTITPELGS